MTPAITHMQPTQDITAALGERDEKALLGFTGDTTPNKPPSTHRQRHAVAEAMADRWGGIGLEEI